MMEALLGAGASALALGAATLIRRLRRTGEAVAATVSDWLPDWGLHRPWLSSWLEMTPADRDGRATPWSAYAEQVDNFVRRYLAAHDLDRLLQADPRAAFVAFSVSEAFRITAREAAFRADRAGIAAGPPVTAAVVAACQRFAWYAAQHADPDNAQPEPFGATTSVSDLPPITPTPEEAPQ